MNVSIMRVFGFFVLLFGVLVVFTSRWTVIEATKLRDNGLNARHLLDQLRVRRGTIRAADGTVLARSVSAADHTFNRVYPLGSLFAQPLGYFKPGAGIPPAGLEASRDSVLSGQRSEFKSLLDELQGKQRIGDNVTTTLDTKAQKQALSLLAGRHGSVVALDPRTGAIKVMAVIPSYNPNFNPLHAPKIRPKNGATQLTDFSPPGSTFKVVTAAAALDSGKYTPDTLIDGKSPITVSGRPLANDNGETFGPVTLTKALTLSINTVFAQVAEKVGRSTMKKYMERFGFDGKPPLDYPKSQVDASGEISSKGGILPPTDSRVDLGRMGIGQDKLQATSLQMAMVAAAVANGGTLMKPHMTDRVIDHDGRTVQTINPSVMSKVMSPTTATELTTMMRSVVEEGTGQTVRLGNLDIAGKTGTAQIGVPGSNLTRPWFIAFAPANKPRIAIAVTVARSQGGFGATVAGPIAQQVLQTLLSGG
ncbi:MAG: Peptidoglycan glycosyltransferase [Solirubrobacterales bacterium]|jgi:peptidoglycan glycosyltransferase|nr:Peptidoglycan glycosyltransferase [Solirubrobacterales bacterium]